MDPRPLARVFQRITSGCVWTVSIVILILVLLGAGFRVFSAHP